MLTLLYSSIRLDIAMLLPHLSKNPSFTPAQVFAAMKADGLRNVIRIRQTFMDILFPGQRRTPNLLLTGKSLLK